MKRNDCDTRSRITRRAHAPADGAGRHRRGRLPERVIPRGVIYAARVPSRARATGRRETHAATVLIGGAAVAPLVLAEPHGKRAKMNDLVDANYLGFVLILCDVLGQL